MSNPTLATKLTRKLKQVPSRLTADICRYLHSDALSSPPTGYQEMIEREKLQFPQAMFPWMIHRPQVSRQPITLEHCQEME